MSGDLSRERLLELLRDYKFCNSKKPTDYCATHDNNVLRRQPLTATAAVSSRAPPAACCHRPLRVRRPGCTHVAPKLIQDQGHVLKSEESRERETTAVRV